MTDVRTRRAQTSIRTPDGKWEGLQLDVFALPERPWAASFVDAIGETQAQGRIVAKVIMHGDTGGARPVLLTNYQGNPYTFDAQLKVNGDEAPISNPFYPPSLGPLAIALADANGNIISDVVAGLGLPEGHHMGFRIEFRRRSEQMPDVPSAPDDLRAEVRRIADELGNIAERLRRLGD